MTSERGGDSSFRRPREGARGRGRGRPPAKREVWAPGPFPDDIVAEARHQKAPFDYAGLRTVGEETHFSSLMPWHLHDNNDALRRLVPAAGVATVLDATAHVGVD